MANIDFLVEVSNYAGGRQDVDVRELSAVLAAPAGEFGVDWFVVSAPTEKLARAACDLERGFDEYTLAAEAYVREPRIRQWMCEDEAIEMEIALARARK